MIPAFDIKCHRISPQRLIVTIGAALGLLFSLAGASWGDGAYSYKLPLKEVRFDITARTVIGGPQRHVVSGEETLLDVARDYNLGFNEIADLYPEYDPWIPPVGAEITIPTQWVLPEAPTADIIINIAELRLYYFLRKIQMVVSFPIGIGDEGWETPLGTFHIREKRVQPTWYIPDSLQEKYGSKIMPPGPENPLGDYYMALSIPSYGIHGTNFPWSVGRLVTHGCIRLYPEDIKRLFRSVEIGTTVSIIYEPVKIGFRSGRIFVEVHRDIYGKIPNLPFYGQQKLAGRGIVRLIDPDKFRQALKRQDGFPVDITGYADAAGSERLRNTGAARLSEREAMAREETVDP